MRNLSHTMHLGHPGVRLPKEIYFGCAKRSILVVQREHPQVRLPKIFSLVRLPKDSNLMLCGLQRSSNARFWMGVAVCCSVLQCVAVCCIVLQCVAVCSSVLVCCCIVFFPLTQFSSRRSVCLILFLLSSVCFCFQLI